MAKTELTINLIIPFLEKTGGIIVILEYFLNLSKSGHDVKIYYPLIPYWNLLPGNINFFRRLIIYIKIILKNLLRMQKTVEWYHNPVKISPVPAIKGLFLRKSDISMATAWPTAYDVHKLDRDKGAKFYFIQGYEIWDDIKLVQNSYRLPLKLITISSWLTNILRFDLNVNVEAEIHNGIRLDRFYPPDTKRDNPVTISMLYHEWKPKGAFDGLKAFSKIKNEFPEIRIMLFGMFDKPEVDFDLEYYQNPSYTQLLSLYQSSHIFLFPSHGEGWGMTPMEALACKCAVVGTHIGCIKEIYNGKNIFIIKPGSPEGAYLGLKSLILNSEERERLAEEGFKTIQDHNWHNSALKLQNVFFNAVNK